MQADIRRPQRLKDVPIFAEQITLYHIGAAVDAVSPKIRRRYRRAAVTKCLYNMPANISARAGYQNPITHFAHSP